MILFVSISQGIVEMGSAGIDDSSQKTIEPELVNIGNKLLRRPSSTDDLLMLLDVCGFMCVFGEIPISDRETVCANVCLIPQLFICLL